MGRQVVIPHPSARDGASEEPKDGAYWSRALVIPSRRRQVSRFWLEKALVLSDGVQLFALMWQLSQPWPWPARWLAATRWTNAFTLDFFSFRATGAAMGSSSQPFSLWGEMPLYWLYAFVWALVPWSAVLALHVAKRLWTKRGRSDVLLRSVEWENVLLQMLQFLYVPVGLAVLRLVNCDADGELSVDPTGMRCGSAGHVLAVIVITCGFGGSFLVGLPWRLRRCIRESIVHSSVDKHERFLQEKELEFMLGTSDTYLELYLPQFASYRRHSVEMPMQICLLKLVLMLTFSILRSSPPSMANQGLQGSLFFFVVVSMAVYRTWRYPYRCLSTSYLAILVDWMLVANGVFVLLCANGVRSALTVSTSVTSSLTFLNLCFFAVVGSIGLRDVVRYTILPQVSQARGLCWPTNEHTKEIVDYGPKLAAWVQAIHNARSTILESLLVIPSMRSCDALKTVLKQVEHCYEEAASLDHPLMRQLYDLALYVHELYVEAVASSPFHQHSFPAMELANLSGVLQRRKDRQLLLSTRSQRVLKKLHIARSWSRRARPYASANVGWDRKHGAIDLQGFLNTESDYLQEIIAVAPPTEWKTVNSVFCLKYQDGVNDSSELLLSILSWSETLGLVRWCPMQNSPRSAMTEVQYFSLAKAKQHCIQLEVVSCGDATNSMALIQALAAPNTASERPTATNDGQVLPLNTQALLYPL